MFRIPRFAKGVFLTTVTLGALVASIPAHAQGVRCTEALIQNTGSLDMRRSTSLALLELHRRTTSSDQEFTAGVMVPIEGIPVQLDTGFSRQEFADYFRSTDLEWSDEHVVSIATQTLSRESVEAYKACVEADSSGPRILVYNATRQAITVTVQWRGTPGTQARGDVRVTGGRLSSPFPTRWLHGAAHTRTVARRDNDEMRITANIGDDTDNAFVAPFPQAAPRPRTLMVGSCVGRGGLEGVRLWGPSSELCNGLQAWGRYDAQVQPVTVLGSCLGHGGVEGVRLYGPVGMPCGGMPNNVWGVYASPVEVRRVGISSCLGHGNVLEGHRLWGPHGQRCGGMAAPEWGTYSEFRQLPQ